MRSLSYVTLTAALLVAATAHADEVLYQSATLENLGTSFGEVNAASVSEFVYTGVRFELDSPVLTSGLGGPVVGSGDFFGALVALDGENDVPESGDLTTPDVLGVVSAEFPDPSAEVYADLELVLRPGWYAIVFGSGLFGTSGTGGIPVSTAAIEQPQYLSGQQGSWFSSPNNSIQRPMVLRGIEVPEPQTWLSLSILLACLPMNRRSR